jgi:hypothetical protein
MDGTTMMNGTTMMDMSGYFSFNHEGMRVLFKSWDITSLAGKLSSTSKSAYKNPTYSRCLAYVGTCIGVLFFAFIYEFLVLVQDYIDVEYRLCVNGCCAK